MLFPPFSALFALAWCPPDASAAAGVDHRWREIGAVLDSFAAIMMGLVAVSAVIAGGLRILSRIDAAGGDVFAHRPVLRKRDWAVVAYRSLVP